MLPADRRFGLTFARIKGILCSDFHLNICVLKAHLSLLFLLLLFATACSDIPARQEAGELIQIQQFSTSPEQFVFTVDDGVRDTTVTATVRVEFLSLSESLPPGITIGYIVRNALNDMILQDGERVADLDASTSEFDIQLPTRTFDTRELGLAVFFLSGNQLVSNVASGNISLRGFAVGLPEVLRVENPDTVRIPADGQPATGFRLKAKVTHPLDQNLVNRVLVNIRDQNNNLLPGSPFDLYDDGGLVVFPSGSTSGDEVAGDSVYTRLFQITSANNPDVYTLFYFATDNFGASSDTVQSTMRFIR